MGVFDVQGMSLAVIKSGAMRLWPLCHILHGVAWSCDSTHVRCARFCGLVLLILQFLGFVVVLPAKGGSLQDCDFMVWQIVLCTARRCLLMQLSVSRCGYCACPLRAPWTVDVLSVGHGGPREYDAVITSCALVAFLWQYQCLKSSRVHCVHCHGSRKRVCWHMGTSFLHGWAAKAHNDQRWLT